ncbi:hypothetical protein Q8F55_005827 [Vanrija albida]|uniref:Uncharacterized protein n=1 Tax=Vanrija albida TaxID=181172 RepID=A0ABR3Q2X1_9TREE
MSRRKHVKPVTKKQKAAARRRKTKAAAERAALAQGHAGPGLLAAVEAWNAAVPILRHRRGHPELLSSWRPKLYLCGIGRWPRDGGRKELGQVLAGLLKGEGINYFDISKIRGSPVKCRQYVFVEFK